MAPGEAIADTPTNTLDLVAEREPGVVKRLRAAAHARRLVVGEDAGIFDSERGALDLAAGVVELTRDLGVEGAVLERDHPPAVADREPGRDAVASGKVRVDALRSIRIQHGAGKAWKVRWPVCDAHHSGATLTSWNVR